MDKPLFPGLDTASSSPSAASGGNNGSVGAVTMEAPHEISKPTLPDLFGESATLKGPATEGSNVVNAVVSQTDTARILGPKPTIHPSIEIPGKGFSISGFFLKLSIFLAVATALFFYSQLQTQFEIFGKNPAQQLSSLESTIQEEQTTLNLYRWTLATYALDEFSQLADHYLYQLSIYESEWTSRNTKTALEAELIELQDSMKTELATVKEHVSATLYPENTGFSALSLPELDDQYTGLLMTRIDSEKQALLVKEGGPYTTEIATLDSVLNLLNHPNLVTSVRTLDFESDLSAESIQALFEYAMEINTSEYLTVMSVKNQRTDWNNLLQSIEALTSQVDPLYESNLPSYIEYSNLSLDAETGEVVLRGTTRTDDSLNFSVISDLIDELEQSDLFMDVETRSFSKSESQDDGYTAQFTISMMLQAEPDERDVTLSTTQTSSSEDSTSTRVETVPTTTTEETSTEEVPTEETSTEPSSDSTETETTSTDEVTDESAETTETSVLDTVTESVSETGAALVSITQETMEWMSASMEPWAHAKQSFKEEIDALIPVTGPVPAGSSRVSRTSNHP